MLDAVVSALVFTIGNVATPAIVAQDALRLACTLIGGSTISQATQALMLQRIADADYAVFRALHNAIVEARGTWLRSKRQVCVRVCTYVCACVCVRVRVFACVCACVRICDPLNYPTATTVMPSKPRSVCNGASLWCPDPNM